MIQVTLLLVLKCAFFYLHPFHLSICEIEHDAKSETLNITSRLFQDDLEVALNEISGTSEYFSEVKEDKIKNDLQKFFRDNLQVIINGNTLTIRFLGFEIEENVVYCYLEITEIKSLGEITIQYTPLIDTFTDQINLAHIRYQGKVRSLKFLSSQLSGTTDFNN